MGQIFSGKVLATALVQALVASGTAVAADHWHKVVGKKDDASGETITDVWPPDLSGSWSEHCSEFSKPKFILKFVPGKYGTAITNGRSTCNLVETTDYNALEVYYSVDRVLDCSRGAPSYLLAEYHFRSPDNYLLVKSKSSTLRLTDCSAGRIQ